MRSGKTTLLVAISLLACLISSSRQAEAVGATSANKTLFKDTPELRSLRAKGYELYTAGRFREAADVYEQGYRAAVSQMETVSAIRFLNNLAGCRFAVFDYRSALSHYLEAQKMADSIHDRALYATLALNIASMRVAIGEVKLAASGLQDAAASLPPDSKHIDQVLIQLGFIHAQSGDLERALPYFQKGLWEAERRGDERLVAKGLDHIGYQYLKRDRLPEAESYLIEAYRRRLMRHDPEVALSYPKLGMLRRLQGDAASAANLFDAAISRKSSMSSPFPLAELHYQRALAKRDLGQTEEALVDLRAAMRWSRNWRTGVLPSDSARVSSGVLSREVIETFIDTASRVRSVKNRTELTDEMFQAAEEQRAASLRESMDTQGELTRHLPPEYPETLARLRAAELALMREETPERKNQITQLLNQISEMESRAGLQLVPREPTVAQSFTVQSVQRRLTPSQVLFSLHAGPKQSYLWAVTSEGATLQTVNGRQQLLDSARQLAKAVSSETPERALEVGRRMYTDLFGSVPAEALAKREWLIVPDSPLFEAPLAALVIPDAKSGAPEYVIERHTLRLLPGIWALFGDRHKPGPEQGSFVGLGDSVYNKADARWKGQPPRTMAMENARLVGSAREVEACARQYGASNTVLLTGWNASRARLESAVAGRPDVLHIAAHVLHTPGPNTSALIHLGLRPSGEAEVLNPSDIVFLSGSPRVVVMSGCASGLGEAIAGEGLMGLTRAWLINGTEAVAASYWPTTDDQGEFFLSFYKHLAERRPETDAPSTASALQAAQLDMLRSHSWRSAPKYWAAFFVIGRS